VFWDELVEGVKRGEMEMHEAHKRHNLYNLASHAACIRDARAYALEIEREILPPVIFVKNGSHNALWHDYVEQVKEGKIGPYEAAWAYYEAVSSGRD
jgi:hypothetical protein